MIRYERGFIIRNTNKQFRGPVGWEWHRTESKIYQSIEDANKTIVDLELNNTSIELVQYSQGYEF